jgi:hypothetical protein
VGWGFEGRMSWAFWGGPVLVHGSDYEAFQSVFQEDGVEIQEQADSGFA